MRVLLDENLPHKTQWQSQNSKWRSPQVLR